MLSITTSLILIMKNVINKTYVKDVIISYFFQKNI